METVPEQYKGRNLYKHNPTVTLMRTNVEECKEIGKNLCEKWSAAQVPMTILLPMKGVSMIDAEGQPFYGPEEDAVLYAEIKKISDSYSMNKLNDEYRKAELKQLDAKGNAVPNPVSNSQMVNEMQKIVDMCLGEGYKVTSHDVTFFEVCYGKKDNKTGLKVTASTHKQVRMTFMDIMKNIMEYSDKKHSGYSIGYKAKKEEDKTPSEEDKKTFTPTGNTATTEPKPQEEPTLKLAEEPKPEEPKTEEVKPEEPKVEEVKTEEPKPEEKPKKGRGKKEKKEI